MMSWCIGWGPRPTLPNSSSNINQVCENIHMLWMGRWIHDHAISTIRGIYIFTRWEKFWKSRLATNDVMVHWLRPQTHMEWFPPPLQRYTRCLRTFICCGWAARSTIMPLPLHLPCVEIREFSKFLGHSSATNDVMVHWLRPQSHMEWFPPPLLRYRRCLKTFLC